MPPSAPQFDPSSFASSPVGFRGSGGVQGLSGGSGLYGGSGALWGGAGLRALGSKGPERVDVLASGVRGSGCRGFRALGA